jgi:hypothetical protein
VLSERNFGIKTRKRDGCGGKIGGGNGKLEIGILNFRGWLRNQHFSPHHHICVNLAEQFGYQEKQKK